MRRGLAVWMGCAGLTLGLVGAAAAEQLSEVGLRMEMARNKTLAAYVERNGLPDKAERQLLSDRPPWAQHEVVLYYAGLRKEIGFARAWILGRPEIHLVRYERPLSDDEVAALASRPRSDQSLARSTGRMSAVDRAEASAARAEEAAGRVEAAAVSAERAAEKAETLVARMETSARRTRRQ